MKKVSITSLILLLVCSLFVSAAFANPSIAPTESAQVSNDDYGLKITYENGEKVLIDQKENVRYYEAFKADGTPVPLEKYMENLKKARILSEQISSENNPYNNSDNEEIVTPLNVVDMSSYSEKQKWTELMTPRRASANINCTGSGQHCPISKGETLTSTVTWGAGLTAGDKSYIKANTSFSWSESSSSNLTYTLYVKVNRTGYLTFAPRYNFTKGDISYMACYPVTGCKNMGSKKDVWAGVPATIGEDGHTNGEFAIAYVNYINFIQQEVERCCLY
ncbi:hypothetical protein [Paenibacillus alvei]|uniref:DUF6060 domain-containing protein n=2 Tax=Paenibacillus alvei TaxID=44250 RepID=UPI0018CCEFAB|nr:hypothetical protein [Paenibacillus alvei]MBG9736663.1 hypothetical protein [Paenibacillus alvei]MBG9747018.1 hypothetical protein [Paenibacillus alvei]MCY9577714.1 hypothetical protein [Paenibacillus alvei]MCY9583081.1 hypothetical protein [Paenibacillus alvei]